MGGGGGGGGGERGRGREGKGGGREMEREGRRERGDVKCSHLLIDLLVTRSKGEEAKSTVDSVGAGTKEEPTAAGLKKKRKKKKKKSSQPELSPSEVAKEMVGEGGGGGGGAGSGDVVKTEQIENMKLSESVCDGVGSKDTAMGLVCNGATGTSSGEGCATVETTPTTSTANTPSSDDVIGVELVAKEENVDKGNTDRGRAAAKEQNMAGMEERRKKLHVCAHCGKAETAAKSFKRCQMYVPVTGPWPSAPCVPSPAGVEANLIRSTTAAKSVRVRPLPPSVLPAY